LSFWDRATRPGFRAKVRVLAKADLDADDWLLLAFALGRESERLGISPRPVIKMLAKRIRDRKLRPDACYVERFNELTGQFGADRPAAGSTTSSNEAPPYRRGPFLPIARRRFRASVNRRRDPNRDANYDHPSVDHSSRSCVDIDSALATRHRRRVDSNRTDGNSPAVASSGPIRYRPNGPVQGLSWAQPGARSAWRSRLSRQIRRALRQREERLSWEASDSWDL